LTLAVVVAYYISMIKDDALKQRFLAFFYLSTLFGHA